MPVSRSRRKLTLTAVIAAAAVIIGVVALIWWLWPEGPRKPFRYASTVAGTGKEIGEPFGIAVKGSSIYVSDGQNDKIWRIDHKGLSVFAEALNTPSGIAFLPNGDLIVADTGSHTIKSVNSKGEVSLVAGLTGRQGHADGDSQKALFNGPIGIAVRGEKIYVADTYNDGIRVIAGGKVTTLAGGPDGVGIEADFDTPTGIAVWEEKLLVADSGTRRVRVIEPDGRFWTLAGTGEADLRDGSVGEAAFVQPTGIAVHSDGTIFVADGNAIREISGDVSRIVKTISNDRRGLSDGEILNARFNRPSGLAFDRNGDLIVTDGENRLVRRLSANGEGTPITAEQITAMSDTAEEFRKAAPGRWPFDPADRARDIAGTLGELRGEVVPGADHLWFHNGLDIAGGYGEIVTFIRDEKVLRPIALENFGTSRELLRLPTIGYIHLRIARYRNNQLLPPMPFKAIFDPTTGNLLDLRAIRGTRFKAGEPIGTVNSMNHVHLIAGRSGSELNALDALDLPGVSDSRPPVIEELKLYDENWDEIETPKPNSRIRLSGKTRIVVRAFDQMDGNSERRRLGVYSVSWGIRSDSPVMHAVMTETKFDRMPSNDLVGYIYANGSRSGATGETIFRYIATNTVSSERYEEGFLDASQLEPGNYTVSVTVADRFGNTAAKDFLIEVIR